MIRRLLVAGLFTIVAPAALCAQRPGIGGFGNGRVPKGPPREPGLVIPAQVNVVNLLIQRRQEVALSDSQFVHVIALKRGLDSANAPLMRTLDSLGFLFRGGSPLFSQPSAARRDSLVEARAVMRETQAALHDNLSTARDKAYALLSEPQLVKAQAIEAKAEKALEDDGRKKQP
jgi:hypothetical protein